VLQNASLSAETQAVRLALMVIAMEQLLEELRAAQFLVDDQGHRTGVLLDIKVWEKLLVWAEAQDKAMASIPGSLRGYLKSVTNRSLSEELIQARREAAAHE
jgi:hypothetical protein